MKQIKIFLVLVLFASFSSYGQTENSWKSINDNGYSIQYPDSWDLDKSGQMGMSFMILSKQTSQQDLFRENVNLLIQNLAGQNIDLNKFVEISESQIKTLIVNGNLLESKRLNVDATTFHKLIYTGEQSGHKFKFEQYYWVQDEKAYILTLTCEAEQFDTYREVGEKIMDSFSLN